jgi:hypothetical protein
MKVNKPFVSFVKPLVTFVFKIKLNTKDTKDCTKGPKEFRGTGMDNAS